MKLFIDGRNEKKMSDLEFRQVVLTMTKGCLYQKRFVIPPATANSLHVRVHLRFCQFAERGRSSNALGSPRPA